MAVGPVGPNASLAPIGAKFAANSVSAGKKSEFPGAVEGSPPWNPAIFSGIRLLAIPVAGFQNRELSGNDGNIVLSACFGYKIRSLPVFGRHARGRYLRGIPHKSTGPSANSPLILMRGARDMVTFGTFLSYTFGRGA